MKATLYFHSDLDHQRKHIEAMRSGLEKHGVTCAYGHYNTPSARHEDFAVIWGSPSKQPAIAALGIPLLIMERGHVGDRMCLTSCGWGELGRRGKYAAVEDGGERWRRMFGHLMHPWVHRTPGRALIIGQVENDAALRGLVLREWVEQQISFLQNQGWSANYRPHPMVRQSKQTLAEELAGVSLCITYNSTTGVEAVLAGVPTVTLDEGAMAWPVTSHTVPEMIYPDRDSWAHRLAWTTWEIEEIIHGEVWEYLKGVQPL